MSFDLTWPEWLAERITDELVRREAVESGQRDAVNAALRALGEEGWVFHPPEVRASLAGR